MSSYQKLIVWQKSFAFTKDIYKVTANFPREEIYGLVSQMRRAALAIPSNIAEGHARYSRKEFIQFLNIAFGSGAELETQLLLARDLQFVSVQDYNRVNLQLGEVMRMLNKLMSSIKQKLTTNT